MSEFEEAFDGLGLLIGGIVTVKLACMIAPAGLAYCSAHPHIPAYGVARMGRAFLEGKAPFKEGAKAAVEATVVGMLLKSFADESTITSIIPL